MATSLQQLAESLGRRLGRSVAIDNPRVHLLAYSPHRGEVDPLRAGSILQRAVPKDVVDHIYACGAGDAQGMFTIVARPDLGLEDPRFGYPIRHQGQLLGFLWLLSSDGSVSEQEADVLARAAADAGLLMHREYLQGGLDRDRERELLTALLSDDARERASAAESVVVEGHFSAERFAVLAVLVNETGRSTSDADRLALAAGLSAIRGRRQSQHVATLERRDGAVLLVTEPCTASARAEVVALGQVLRDAVLAESDTDQCWVGIGAAQEDLSSARSSYDDARRSAQVCRRVATLDAVMPVESLGVFDLLAQVPTGTLDSMLHPGLRSLIEQSRDSQDPLVHSLEVYLDNAGDVKSTAEQLFVHRTSLYYRLRRVQDLTGLDLSDGDDRLIAHLGLRIARLTGLLGAEPPGRG